MASSSKRTQSVIDSDHSSEIETASSSSSSKKQKITNESEDGGSSSAGMTQREYDQRYPDPVYIHSFQEVERVYNLLNYYLLLGTFSMDQVQALLIIQRTRDYLLLKKKGQTAALMNLVMPGISKTDYTEMCFKLLSICIQRAKLIPMTSTESEYFNELATLHCFYRDILSEK